MRKSKFSDSQIMNILKEFESGVSAADLCRKYGMSQGAFYKWKSKFGGMDASLIKEMRALREENGRLKKMYAETEMDKMILKEALEKKW